MAAKDRRVTIRLPEEAYIRLAEKAARNDVSVAWLIRRALTDSLTAERRERQAGVEQKDVSARFK